VVNTQPGQPNQPAVYEVKLRGHLGDEWSDWFGGASIALQDDGDTVLTCTVSDQAALHGLLKKVRDLGIPLLSVTCIDSERTEAVVFRRRAEASRAEGGTSMKDTQMRAIIGTQYGSPEVLQLKEVAKPIPGDNEVLIKVHAGSVTPADCAFRKADPVLIRFLYGLTRPKYAIPGVEFAGEIEAVGKDVKSFKPGEQVFGLSPDRFGAHAEYLCLPEDKPMTMKPAGMSYEEAAGILDGATTALTFLRDEAKLERGQKVLINGASGAVGYFAVQLAKHYGAEVTGVCSAANAAFVKSMGADFVIDYAKEDFTQGNLTYDVIFDAVGKSSFSRCKNVLTETGVYLTTVPAPGVVWHMLLTSKSKGKKARFVASGLMQKKSNLDFLGELHGLGKIRTAIDRRYPLAHIVEAHRYVETGHKKGNVVITFECNKKV
jgi:NADPH:quinone reductase-like Zn-dependent oxidoreductase